MGGKGLYLVVSQQHMLLEGSPLEKTLPAENTSEEWPLLGMDLLMFFQSRLGGKGLATHLAGLSATALSWLLSHHFLHAQLLHQGGAAAFPFKGKR